MLEIRSLATVFGPKTSGLARVPRSEKMKAVEIVRECSEDHFACSICGNFLFEIEQVSQDKARLTCKNCGQCHLIVAESKVKNQIIVKFCNENKNKWNIS